VIGVFTHTGFQDAADGASHQGLHYLATTAAIPHLTQYCPATAEEAEWAMEYAIRTFVKQRMGGEMPDSVVFFCGRENWPETVRPEGVDYAWGKAMTLRDSTAGKDTSVVISAVGYMANLALEAADKLEAAGIGAVVLNNSTPNRPDVAAHREALAKCGGRLVTVEDHQAVAGAGAMLTTALSREGVDVRLELLAVPGEFGRSAYEALQLYDRYGLGPEGIVAAAQRLA
jgi:transketolase